jgi:hypothetical protein
MSTVESGFVEKAREDALDTIEREFVGKQANLIYEFVELVHTRLEAYAQRHGYDVASTIDSVQQPEVSRSGDQITVTVGWASEQMQRWEFGTSDHTVKGDPLVFVWHDPPQWVREEFDQARGVGGQFATGYQVFLPETNVAGLPESRAIRDSMHAIRRVIES